MSRSRRTVALVTWISVAALMASGCSPVGEKGPRAVDLGVIVQQNRSDIAKGMMSIQVHNLGTDPVVITEAVLDDDRFDSSAKWTGSTELSEGATRDLRVPVPAAACNATEAAATTTTLTVSSGGPQQTVRMPVEDPFDFIATVTAQQCSEQELLEYADLSFGDLAFVAAPEGDVAELHVRVAARGSAAVTVRSVQRTILFQPEGGGAEWTVAQRIEAGSEADVTLRAEPGRCDPHAIAEDKVGTRFPVRLEVATVPPLSGTVTLVATRADRAALFDYLTRRCAG